MGFLKSITPVLLAAIIILLSLFYNSITKPELPPKIDERYWGPGLEPKQLSSAITPLKITFTDEMISDLKHRLSNVRLQPPLEGVAQEYGMNTDLLREILTYWRTKYAFKERQAYLNKYPHFVTNIQGLDMHYIHVKPKPAPGMQVLPLLILHGWPGSVREFYEIMPYLTEPQPHRAFVFEVIAPSLPGFGYSQAAAKPGMGAPQMATVMRNLMLRIGHEKFYVQGGDWGGIITSYMGSMFNDNILGIHSNMCAVLTPLSWIKRIIGAIYSPLIVDDKYADRMYPLSLKFKEYMLESGYYHIQATKPDTVGVGLNDSPAGLAAYILEKFVTGTNSTMRSRKDGGLKEAFQMEQLLDNIMMYWVTNSMTSAARIYAESKMETHRARIEVPSACANFRYEIMYAPANLLRERYVNLVQNMHYDVGGHFIALQMPQTLSDDIYSAVTKMIAHKI